MEDNMQIEPSRSMVALRNKLLVGFLELIRARLNRHDRNDVENTIFHFANRLLLRFE